MHPTIAAKPLRIKLAGVGRKFPERIVTSDEVEKACGLPAGWCAKKNGIEARHWADKETSTDLAASAVTEALGAAQLKLEELQLLINASTAAEQIIPDGSAFILNRLGLGAGQCSGFSIHTTCTSFVTAIDVVAALIDIGRYDNAVIVSSEVSSGYLHPSAPETYTLIGDGAAAAVFVRTPENERSCVVDSIQKSFGYGREFAEIKLGSKLRYHEGTATRDDFIFRMNGKSIIKFGNKYVPEVLDTFFERSGLDPKELELVITHQASKIALDLLSLTFGEKKIVRALKNYGNCGCASIPITLYEAVTTNRMKRDDRIMICGPGGAGMNIAAVSMLY